MYIYIYINKKNTYLTKKRYGERTFGTNVLVLGKRRDNFLSPSQTLKKDVQKIVV